ncbi:hypothetical protein ASPZODRAFT_148431 [Penicilliopsis zonata CBS 506.65]|uniref:BRCT domain-containing protein n=1 Tax=Penicilliopsis zonata CBS 506.65 TaxID=1073090 RepID=A0A1L9SV55_9EURO|nr:hypothetical protein ASPZODRAFT_148431 [Penicilliopsis zonata CBS 506.65]OJJ51068.1 hypothetical protein ASPZODRAFT_148431 [Penicilliopsis zonata CBS 506.65]
MAEKATSNREHPLAGVVLCFTSILPEQRTDLVTIAGEMGATHKFDLTSDVTHLLVGELNTAKYKFVARERSDVIVLKPDWIEAVRQSWMQGGDTDIRALEEQYRLPTFMGLAICITGFEDMAFRNYIREQAMAHGAEFRKDLTKTVTHLISRGTEGQKYKFATQWNVKVVSMKWFTDSVERGMVLEETLYHPLVPAEQQGEGAWNRSTPTIKTKAPNEDDSSNPRPRKLRRVASTKLVDQNEGIWGDIMGGGFDISESKRSLQRQQSEILPARPVLQLQESKSFASETTLDFRPEPALEQEGDSSNGFLHGYYFFIHGFSEKQVKVLSHHLEFNGAQLVASLSEFARPEIPKTGHGLYTIVPYKMPKSQIPCTDDMAFECEVVTDMWLEQCLDVKALVSPDSHVANKPFPRFPIAGFNGLRICSTGFARIELLHLSKVVTLMGASYDEYLTPKASILICNDPRSASYEKLRHASEWGAYAVSADWFWDSVRSGQKKPFESYIVKTPGSQDERASQSRSTPSKLDRPSISSNKTNGQTQGTPGEAVEKKTASVRSNRASPAVDAGPDLRLERNGNMPKDLTKARMMQPPSASSSPTKEMGKDAAEIPAQRPGSNHSNTSVGSSALDLAMSGLLKQARAANSSRLLSDGNDKTEGGRSRKRKPLLGRAPSNTVARPAQGTIFSRASSIDTLNDDGCGSTIEPASADGHSLTRANSLAGQSFNSLLTGTRVEFTDDPSVPHEDENEAPAMTQLNYEDPDAVAMREKFLAEAGKLTTKKPVSLKQETLVAEVTELDDLGWRSRRRTRQGNKAPDDFLDTTL